MKSYSMKKIFEVLRGSWTLQKQKKRYFGGKKCFGITQTSPHSHIPAEQGNERLAGNLNTCRLQGFSSAIKERPRGGGKKGKKKELRVYEVWNLETEPLQIFIKD